MTATVRDCLPPCVCVSVCLSGSLLLIFVHAHLDRVQPLAHKYLDPHVKPPHQSTLPTHITNRYHLFTPRRESVTESRLRLGRLTNPSARISPHQPASVRISPLANQCTPGRVSSFPLPISFLAALASLLTHSPPPLIKGPPSPELQGSPPIRGGDMGISIHTRTDRHNRHTVHTPMAISITALRLRDSLVPSGFVTH